jgi:hypothetical protein
MAPTPISPVANPTAAAPTASCKPAPSVPSPSNIFSLCKTFRVLVAKMVLQTATIKKIVVPTTLNLRAGRSS